MLDKRLTSFLNENLSFYWAASKVRPPRSNRTPELISLIIKESVVKQVSVKPYLPIGLEVVRLNNERGLTLKQLSEKSEVDYTTLMALLRHTKKPLPITVKKIADVLEVTYEHLNQYISNSFMIQESRSEIANLVFDIFLALSDKNANLPIEKQKPDDFLLGMTMKIVQAHQPAVISKLNLRKNK